jgi:streptogramin lyase
MLISLSWARGAAAAAAGLLAASCGSSGEPDRAAPAALEAVRAGAPVDLGRSPSALAVGGGAVWVVDAAARTLTRVDAATRRAGRRVAVPGGPFAVAVGEGAAWVAAGDGRSRATTSRQDGRPAGPRR